MKPEIAREYLAPLSQHMRDLLSEFTPATGPIPLFPDTTWEMRVTMIDQYNNFHSNIRNKLFVLQQWVNEESVYWTQSHLPYHRINYHFKQMAAHCECALHPLIPSAYGS